MSFLRKTYYHLKPYLPLPVRLTARRYLASQILSRSRDIWPIKQSARAVPQDWPGWPDGKKFAVVLTHDVESARGLSRCLDLANLEESLGFRSSFNFIPEGDYRVPDSLRSELASRGFEVGVHDLHHNGKLYSSRAEFQRHAGKINQYLRDWNAVGFRSGFMHHNLDWLHDLDIAYDMSTFDTDPFEPQPDGADTIFPFWVPAPPASVSSSEFALSSSQFDSHSPIANRQSALEELQRSPRLRGESSSDQSKIENRQSTLSPRPSPSSANSTLDNRQSTLTLRTSPLAPCPSHLDSPSSFNLRPSTLSRQGYMELPYTLPQDSTLFLLLDGKDNSVWKKKLDWITRHGGMALLNVHPDYINFEGDPSSQRGYSIRHYTEFLEYIRAKYAEEAWFALPHQVAAHCARSRPTKASTETQSHNSHPIVTMPPFVESYQNRKSQNGSPTDSRSGNRALTLEHAAESSPQKLLTGKRVAVVVFSYYPSDPRVRREAEAMAGSGAEIDVFCLKNPDEPAYEVVNGINVYRLPLERQRSGKIRYFYQYGYFLALTLLKLGRREFKSHYDLVHVHNMPDVLVFAGLIPKLRGAKVILDLHDPTPELYITLYNLDHDSAMVRFLNWLEQRSIGFADLAITPNIAFKEIFVRRGCPENKMIIVMNSPQTEVFEQAKLDFTPSPRKPGEFRLMFHGSLLQRHGLEDLVRAVKIVRSEIPGIQLHIYGSRTPHVAEIEKLVTELDLNTHVFYHGGRPLEQIARLILDTDLGIIPNKRTPFTEINMPTRIFEYLAMGKPVIAPRTKGIRDYFNENQIIFFEPGNAEDLAERICSAAESCRLNEIASIGQTVYNPLDWDHQKATLMTAVANLFRG